MKQAQAAICVIVGASHAGSLLALQVRKEGWQGRIILLSAETHLPYHRPPLSKTVLAGEKTVDSILLRPELLYINNQIELRLGAEVVSIAREQRQVCLASGECIAYDKLALCTGAMPRRLAMAESLPGVHYLRNADDVLALRAVMTSAQRAVILGGGYIGLEVAAVMASHGLQVTVVEATPRLLQRVASPVISEYFRCLHESRRVQVRTGTTVTDMAVEQDELRLSFSVGEDCATDLLIVGIGVLPQTELAAAAGLEVDEGIVVDAHMRTSDPDIVAAGDCTAFPSARYGRRLRLESVQNALDQARVAAASICGKTLIYEALPWFWSDQYEYKLQSAGLRLDHEQEIVRGNPELLDAKGISVFYLRGDRMIAADCVNRAKEFMACKRLIAERLPVNLAALRDETASVDDFEQR